MVKIISILFVASMQTIIFIFLHDYLFNTIFTKPPHPDLNWGISLEIALFEFVIFSLLLNIFLLIYKNVKATWPIISAIVLYSVAWVNDLLYTPAPTLKLLISAAIGFLSYYLFIRLLRAISKKFVEAPHRN